MTTAVLSASDLATQFDADPGYLNAATMGVPPRIVVDALRAAVDEWATGNACPVRYGEVVNQARDRYARLVGVEPDLVSVGSQVSVTTGLLAAALPAEAEVLCVDGDFSSMVFPFLARGLRVRHVPLTALADEIKDSTTLVAFSLVQSADGAVADLDAVLAAAQRTSTRTYVDVTQAVGWLPFDASRVDMSVCSGYKWLCQPRGTSYLTIRRELLDQIVPLHAGWYAGEQVWESCYGPDMTLARSARRFDVSPAWLCWLGAAAALEVFTPDVVRVVHNHDVAIANAVRAGLGLAPTGSAIVAIRRPGAQEALSTAGLRVASRAGNVRIACHLWNDTADVDRVLAALAPLPEAPAR